MMRLAYTRHRPGRLLRRMTAVALIVMPAWLPAPGQARDLSEHRRSPALLPEPGESPASPAGSWLFTSGLSHLSDPDRGPGNGVDLNLRYSRGDSNVWMGWFHSARLDLTQWRAGWDDRIKLGPVAVIPSLQVASGGFIGGSVAAEVGELWFSGIGLGRTNLRDYINLNFDPNDAWFVYGGLNDEGHQQIEIQLVRDNREHPDQQHVHLVWRRHLRDDERLTLDLLFKQGTVEDRFVRRTGLSVRYDWSHWYVRLAWDPLVNFTAQDMARLQIGRRF